MRKYGIYGFLNQGNLSDEPLILLDFGLERRQNERYDFDNSDRHDFGGFLFQYTLEGYGCFETEGKTALLTPGTAFFSWIPEKSRYYLPSNHAAASLPGEAILPQSPVKDFMMTESVQIPIGSPGAESVSIFDPSSSTLSNKSTAWSASSAAAEKLHSANHWEYLYVHLDGPAIQPFFRQIREEFGSCFTLPQDSFPIQLWLNLHEELGNGRQLRRYEGGELAYRFLSSLLRTLETPAGPLPSPRIAESLQYLREHFAEHLSIEALASEYGFSSAYFTRLFTRETGISPMAFLTQQRLSHAVFLLLNSSLTIEEIAAGCGFSCGNYFCKVFRKASGLSPAEYRRRYGG